MIQIVDTWITGSKSPMPWDLKPTQLSVIAIQQFMAFAITIYNEFHNSHNIMLSTVESCGGYSHILNTNIDTVMLICK